MLWLQALENQREKFMNELAGASLRRDEHVHHLQTELHHHALLAELLVRDEISTGRTKKLNVTDVCLKTPEIPYAGGWVPMGILVAIMSQRRSTYSKQTPPGDKEHCSTAFDSELSTSHRASEAILSPPTDIRPCEAFSRKASATSGFSIVF